MKDTARTVLLLGHAAETDPQLQPLGSAGYRVLAHLGARSFLDSLCREEPFGAVIWDSVPEEDLADVLEVLRHRFRGRDCAVVIVRSSERSWRGEDVVRGVLEAPVEPASILSLLDECSQTSGQPGEGIPRVLVVDDDQSIVLLGTHIVSSLGMIPLVAFDGPQAVDRAKRLDPDLILLDINMPQMDGFEVIRALKAEATTSLIPIIVFSARREETDKVRALRLGADDYVTKPFSITELGARIDRLIQRTRTGVSASSTTGLPGSVSIEQILTKRTVEGGPLAILYIDADHFKAFNDRYGFSRGDGVIRQSADVILDAVRKCGNADDFVGHIGGDDFVAVTTPDLAVPIAEEIIRRFARIVPYYYDQEDREKGYIETEDRKGRSARFPLMTLSISIVTNESREFHHPGEIADVAAQLKRFAKTQGGSVWVKDQRSSDG